MHDQRRDAGERPGRHADLLVAGAEPDGQLAVEHVEEVGVAPVYVQVGAVAVRPEARVGYVQGVMVREDRDATVRRVADDLAAARRHQERGAHRGA